MKRQQNQVETCYDKDTALQTLESIQTWIGSMDAKASYAITLVGVLIGFMLSSDDHTLNVYEFFQKVQKHLNDGVFNWSIFILVLLYAVSFYAVFCFIQVLVARTKSKSKMKSNFFFGTIASRDLDSFKASAKSVTTNKMLDDLLEQIHINSEICVKKSRWYNAGHWCLLGTVTLWFMVAIFKM